VSSEFSFAFFLLPFSFVAVLRLAALLSLLVTIAAGLFGPADPTLNVGMTLFWVCFLLALAYVTVIAGDIYSFINPWQTLASAVARAGVDLDRSRLRYPRAVGYWPAVVAYIALVWIELFALPRPSMLAANLIAYTALTFVGMFLFGRSTWLRYGDVFAVFFRVIGSLAPIAYVSRPGEAYPRVALRRPLSGALEPLADHPSLVVFILFMLSSTTYDTIHETYVWISLYWQRLVPLVQPLWGTDVIAVQSELTTGYWWYQWLGLVLSPLVYLALYVAVLWMAVVVTRSKLPMVTLAERFIFSLVPIAVAYHATHYFPSMLMQLAVLPAQLADPFGLGWQPGPLTASSGLGPFVYATPPLPMSVIWHVQVALLLGGHVAGVYLAHVEALRLFETRGRGVVSQLPMLALMVGYTGLGLWVLSLPLGVPR
jgi:hypothetical protein